MRSNKFICEVVQTVIVLGLKLSFEVVQNLNSLEVKLKNYFQDKKWNTNRYIYSVYIIMLPSCPILPPLVIGAMTAYRSFARASQPEPVWLQFSRD